VRSLNRSLNRLVGGISRRAGRPEWLAAVDATARTAQREAIAMSAVLAATLRGNGTYVDVGTNRGQVLREAVRIAPEGRQIAFEPIPSLAAEVRSAFPRVDVREKALGGEPGEAEFCHFRKLDGWSGLRRSPEISDAEGDPEFITVQVGTLDAELADETPRVIKIDVEGAELAVLEGARELLARARPILIFEHVAASAGLYGDEVGAPWDVLSELGYDVFAVTGEGPFSRAAFTAAGGVVNWLAAPRGADAGAGAGA
jgi:FkbM family methyltransferase